MRFSSSTLRFLSVAAVCCCAQAAVARPALCSTTDDGTFPCHFRATDRNGSFRISAGGKPTFILNMVAPGVGEGYVSFGGRNTPLPGRYFRDQSDPACWVSESTRTKICAR